MELRYYQQEAKDAVLNSWKEGKQRVLIVIPTACGKTVIFSSVIQEKLKEGKLHVLILAHRGELLNQATNTIKEMMDMEAFMIKGSNEPTEVDLVCCASIQTMSKLSRLNKYDKDYFDIIIIDEAHHAVAKTYLTVLDHFNSALVLGVTGTPSRGDKKDLVDIFECIPYEYKTIQAIADGYLPSIKAKTIPIKIDLSDANTIGDDIDLNDIALTIDPYLKEISKEMVKYCKGRKTVVFLPLIRTSQAICHILNSYGLNCVEVNGKTTNREEILNDFREGKYDVICSSIILTEGWDCPIVDTVVILRPTQIRSFYEQMVGRGLRLYPGKDHLLLLDFLWLSAKHDICKGASLYCGDEDGPDEWELTGNGGEVTYTRNVKGERERTVIFTLNRYSDCESVTVNPVDYELHTTKNGKIEKRMRVIEGGYNFEPGVIDVVETVWVSDNKKVTYYI